MPSDLAQCQLDSYLQTFITTVVDCTPSNPSQPADTADKKKKSREEKKETTEQLYDVQLTDTILYPEGGGQPTDTGTIDGAPVRAVQRTSGDRILHQSPVSFQPGQQVTVVVDWGRRYDHMQQHSAQHLISSQLLALPPHTATVGWWLASSPTECYIDTDTADITPQQLAHIEQSCNTLIRSALPITVHTFPSVAAALDDPTFTARLPTHKVLSDDFTGTVRVIEVSGVDMNPCGGTHLRSTAELQLIHLTRTEKVKGRVRVYFLAGDRTLRTLRDTLTVSRGLAAVLSCQGEEQIGMVTRLQSEARAAGKSNTKLLKELAELTAQQLITSYRTAATAATASTVRLLTLHRDETPLSFCQAVADSVSGAAPEVVLFLTCTEGSEGKEGAWLLCGEGVDKYGGEVGKMMEGRGGGKGRKVQGKASRIDKRTDVVQWLEEKLSANKT